MTSDRDDERPAEPTMDSPGEDAVPAERLLAGRTELLIELKGEYYRLRLTRRGRLILTK